MKAQCLFGALLFGWPAIVLLAVVYVGAWKDCGFKGLLYVSGALLLLALITLSMGIGAELFKHCSK